MGRKGLATAKSKYQEYAQRLQATFSYTVRGTARLGSVQLFIPHVHDNGLLAYWPDADKYIAKQDFSDI